MRDATRKQIVYPIVRQKPRFVPTNSFYSGEDLPSVSIGSIGDFYLKFQGPTAPPPTGSSVLLYGPKTAQGWGTPVELVGSQGLQGEAGATGPSGQPGLNGKTILSGIVDPNSEVGADGDFYLNTVTKTFFGPKEEGSWPSGFSIVGPTGLQGEQGPQPWSYLGDYDNGYSYTNNDAVTFGGGFYVRYSDPLNPGYAPPDPSRWYTVASPGTQGPQGLQGLTGPAGPSYDGKTGNTIWVTKQTGGAYTSLQDAIDQAVAGDTILVGAGNWGDITLKAGVNITGLQPVLGDKVVVSKITFISQIDTSAGLNTIFISNLRVSNSDNVSMVDIKPDFFLPPSDPDNPTEVQPINGGPFRITFSGCRFYRNNSTATQPLVKISSAEGDTDSSVYFDNCIFSPESSQNSANLIQTSVRYLDLNNCKLWGGAKALRVLSGSVAVLNCRFETSYSGPSISLEAQGAGLTLGESLIRNLGGVSSKGILLVAGSICAVSNTVFDISSNSGTACIEGPLGSVCYYGNITAVTPQPNPSTGMFTEQRSTNISGALTKIPFTQVS